MRRILFLLTGILAGLSCLQVVFAADPVLEITDCKGTTTQIANVEAVGVGVHMGEASLEIPWGNIRKVVFSCNENDTRNIEYGDEGSKFQIKGYPVQVTAKDGTTKDMLLKWFYNDTKAVPFLNGKMDFGRYSIYISKIKQILVVK